MAFRTATWATNVRGHILDACALLLDPPGWVEMKTKIKNETTDPPDPNKINPLRALPTPISTENLEAALCSHPNQNFVLELCN